MNYDTGVDRCDPRRLVSGLCSHHCVYSNDPVDNSNVLLPIFSPLLIFATFDCSNKTMIFADKNS